MDSQVYNIHIVSATMKNSSFNSFSRPNKVAIFLPYIVIASFYLCCGLCLYFVPSLFIYLFVLLFMFVFCS